MLMFQRLLIKLLIVSNLLIGVFAFASACRETYETDIVNAQNNLWMEYNKNPSIFADKIYKKIQSQMSMDQDNNSYYLGTGMTETYLVKFKNGFSGIFKPFPEYWKKKAKNKAHGTNPNAEVLASLLSHHLGLTQVPVTVLKDLEGMKGSLQLFIPKSENELQIQEGSTHELSEMKVFDFLINNLDRRRDNYFYSDYGLVAIDHSQSFSTAKSPLSLHEVRSAIASLSKNKIQQLSNLNREKIDALAGALITTEQKDALMERLQFIQNQINK